MMDWNRLLCGKRFGDLLGRETPDEKPADLDYAKGQFRLPQERDHDRILFSTPFRRLGDKTQVFPLESIESIRTRLTHSYEVANLARSIGTEIAVELADELPPNALRLIPATLAAAALAHDIGNPPFGHQGEYAIRAWFDRNQKTLFSPADHEKQQALFDDSESLSTQHRNDFLHFEGNAQTLRVLTKLQVIGDDLGLNLTLGTLASLMKYVAPSHELDKSKEARKKVGFFLSEESLVNQIRSEVGLINDARHPLALLMEACDDIAYSIVDAEDAIKKGIVSLNDLLAFLKVRLREQPDRTMKYVIEISEWELKNIQKPQLHPSEAQDVATQKFRVHAIHIMVCAATRSFRDNYTSIMAGTFQGELLDHSEAAGLCSALKQFNRENAFSHKSVLEIELNG